METVSLLQEIINCIGFPIAMVLYFIWDKEKSLQPILQAVQNNTIVLNKLLTKIDQEELLEVNENEK